MSEMPFPPPGGHHGDGLEPEHPALVDPQGWHWVRSQGNLPHVELEEPMVRRQHGPFHPWSPYWIARRAWDWYGSEWDEDNRHDPEI